MWSTAHFTSLLSDPLCASVEVTLTCYDYSSLLGYEGLLNIMIHGHQFYKALELF